MIEKFCNQILKRMRKKMPEMTDEKAEIILYGLQLIIGEIPKVFLLFVVSFLLGIGWYMVFAYIVIMPYRAVSGGFHLHTHIGCILGSCIFFYGNIFISKFLVLDNIQKYILVGLSLIFGIVMVSKYAPADTENVPILSKKERKLKKTLSYITLILTLAVSLIIKEPVLSNILIIGTIMQTILITKLAYKLTNNKYGYKEYLKQAENNA